MKTPPPWGTRIPPLPSLGVKIFALGDEDPPPPPWGQGPPPSETPSPLPWGSHVAAQEGNRPTCSGLGVSHSCTRSAFPRRAAAWKTTLSSVKRCLLCCAYKFDRSGVRRERSRDLCSVTPTWGLRCKGLGSWALGPGGFSLLWPLGLGCAVDGPEHPCGAWPCALGFSAWQPASRRELPKGDQPVNVSRGQGQGSCAAIYDGTSEVTQHAYSMVCWLEPHRSLRRCKGRKIGPTSLWGVSKSH